MEIKNHNFPRLWERPNSSKPPYGKSFGRRPYTLGGGYEASYIANLCFTFFISRKPYGSTPPHYVIGSNFMRSCRILLKIELHTDQEHSYRFPECFCDSVIFGTPLAHFSSQGASKITKVTHTLSHYPDLRLHRQYTYSIAPYDSGWHYSAVQCQPASFQDISQRS